MREKRIFLRNSLEKTKKGCKVIIRKQEFIPLNEKHNEATRL